MHDYNIEKTDSEKVHFVGYDMLFLSYTTTYIKNRIQIVDVPLYETYKNILDSVTNFSSDNYSTYDHDTIKYKLDELVNQIEKNKSKF